MKTLRLLFKIFVICVLATAVAVAAIALYMKFFGKGALETALSNALGSQVRFKGVSLDIGKGAVNFQGFTILNKVEFENNIFKAEKFIVKINKEKFEKEKKFVLEEVFVKNGTLTIERNKKGAFNIASSSDEGPFSQRGAAYAADGAAASGFYNFANSLNGIHIEDSAINFVDYNISQNPFRIAFDNFNMEFRSQPQAASSSGHILAECNLSFEIPSEGYRSGEFSLEANMAVYPSRTDVEAAVRTKHINMMRFIPYLRKYTPFLIRSGFFSSTTKVRVHENYIDSPTTMIFNNLKLSIDPAKQNAEFFETAVNRLGPYLESGQDGLIFDFVIKGPVNKPQAALGPRVKFAIGMVALEEFTNALQQLQKLRN